MKKITTTDVETMYYLRDKGFTQKAIAKLLDCHPTLVEYYTTPGRSDYVKNYIKGVRYKNRISKMNPISVVEMFS